VFGDLMAGLLGAFVLILVCALGVQLELATRLKAEVQQRQAEVQRRVALEQALAGPLAAGRVTLANGRIGISGSVLFAFNSDQLQPEGRQLLKSLAAPLAVYLAARDELLMVSGFTDDRQVREGQPPFADNWELSAQRALTVTRALIEDGVPSSAGLRRRLRPSSRWPPTPTPPAGRRTGAWRWRPCRESLPRAVRSWPGSPRWSTASAGFRRRPRHPPALPRHRCDPCRHSRRPGRACVPNSACARPWPTCRRRRGR
jgi:outer membrane protein OmpA-like peptidoglycan-associated protein